MGRVLRIVVAQPRAALRARTSDTVAALSRIDGELELELVHDARGCLALTAARRIDLVVVDDALGTQAGTIVERLAPSGLPVLWLARAAGAPAAGDSVHRLDVGDDLHDRLPGAAMRALRSVASRDVGAVVPAYEHSIIANMNSAFLVVDRAGRITWANADAERILGCEDRGATGQSVWDFFDPELRGENAIQLTLETGSRFKAAETRIVRRDGTIVPIGISCSPIRGRDDASLAAVATFQDLSEVQQLRSSSLQTEKLASIGQLAAGVAHEINNPMGFIHANLFQMSEYVTDLRRLWSGVGALQAAAEKVDDPAVHEARVALEALAREVDVDFVLEDFAKALLECQEGSERIRHIVQDLRDFSRADDGEASWADVNQCVDSTANIVWSMMKHCVDLQKDYGDLPRLRCNAMQLKQVFMNLLVNAYQAIEEAVGSSGEKGRIAIETRRRDDGVAIRISDTGAGIAAADLDRIFDPFFTTKEVGSGTGLGLSTSFRIVEDHGGTLRAESVPGEGSCFEVWLPEARGDDV